MTLIGRPVRRTEDRLLLTRGGRYVDDLDLDGALSVVFVRSTVAHGRITAVRTSAAEAVPGVAGVFTASAVDLPPLPPEAPVLNQAIVQPLLAGDVVRFVGEPVAAVVAGSRAVATDAAALVEVGYEELPAVTDPAAAVTDELVVHPDAKTNTVLKLSFARPAGRADILGDCEVVVRERIHNQRVAACPLETRAGAARWDGDRLTYFAGSQAAHMWRGQLATALGVPEEQVRVVTGDVGGAFGSKAFSSREDVLVAWLARRLGRPVRWAETRSESMVAAGHGRAQWQEVELGGTRDGRVQAYRLGVVQDSGAYARAGAILPFWTRTMVTGPYQIAKAKFTASSVVTTTTPVVSYRGAGQPEAVAALERMMDRYATEIGMDPAEVRRRNLIPRDRFPWTTLTRTTYDTGDYEAALDRVLAAAGYDDLRAEQRLRRDRGDVRQLGIGLSVFVELTGADTRSEYAALEIRPGGRALVHTGTCPHGQGHATSWAMLVAEVLGIGVDAVEVVAGDTGRVASGGGTGGSRSLQTGGMAVRQAALAMLDEAVPVAAKLLDAEPSEVEFRDGRFIAPDGASVDWAALGPLKVETTFTPTGPTAPFGAHLVVVEVDTETGKVDLRRVVAVDDAGTILNPLIAEGQVHGGLAQGLAQALTEEIRYTGDGQPLHRDLSDYAFISAGELPSFETGHMCTPTPVNPLGAKGLGESGAVGVPPAAQNAVIDAVSHLGVRHIDMPLTPERVWQAIQSAS